MPYALRPPPGVGGKKFVGIGKWCTGSGCRWCLSVFYLKQPLDSVQRPRSLRLVAVGFVGISLSPKVQLAKYHKPASAGARRVWLMLLALDGHIRYCFHDQLAPTVHTDYPTSL